MYCFKHDRHFDSDFDAECADCEDEASELDEIQEDATSMEEKFDAIMNKDEWQKPLDNLTNH